MFLGLFLCFFNLVDFLVAANCSDAHLLFNTYASIVLESWSYIIMMYSCPVIGVTVNITQW